MPFSPGNAVVTKTNWYRYAPDLMILLLYFFFLDPVMKWQLNNLALSCRLLMLLNIIAVGLGCYTFFSAYTDMDALKKYRNSLSAFESTALGLSAFISCFAFFWWLVPFEAVKGMGVKETGFIGGMGIYSVTFIAAVASGVNNKNGNKVAASPVIKISNTIATIAFLFFSYAFLLTTLPSWQHSFVGAPYIAMLCMVIFYLPLRFFLILRPPFHRWEYVNFILAFGVLLMDLFVKL